MLSFSAPVLAIDASSAAGSAAVWLHGRLCGAAAVPMGAGQSDQLFPAIARLLEQANIAPSDLSAVVCGAGPGSFTSLRIGAAVAKGLAHGAGAALYAVPSLLLAAASVVPSGGGGERDGFVVHADALRGERYVLPVHVSDDLRVYAAGPLARLPADSLAATVAAARRAGVVSSPWDDELPIVTPDVCHLPRVGGPWRDAPVTLEAWEPEYGRMAEAQVQWEERHGVALPDTPAVRA